MATYKTLSAGLNWTSGLPPSGTTVAVAGGLEAEGSVVLPHFINSTLDNGGAVILLSFRHTFNHYVHIMRKMGVNLSQHKLQFVNGLVQTDLSSLPAATRPHYTLGEWPEFYAWLASQPPSVLVVDGLCTLLDLGHTCASVIGFVNACQRIVEDKRDGHCGLVVNMLLDEFSEPLARALIRRAHYAFNFEGLASGASIDVSGQLTVAPGHLLCQVPAAARDFKPALLHYRVSDTTVQFFAPGQPSIVL
ncbi:Elongator subunit elp6 [Coemansia biformis]|uniref:Elongator subunit elp6 n=1 Tax=Coemansia biformis TaxID=1286918 RepID=A0A9W7YB17_9FUNG|nr:Elongator subunit elp6 [Coemansia biformis]